MTSQGRAVSFKSAKQLSNGMFKNPPISHPLGQEVYTHYKLQYDDCLTTRKDQTLIAKLRTGKWKGFREYKSRIDKGETDPHCKYCPGKIHDLRHWMTDCQANDELRRKLFGMTRLPLSIAATEPLKLVQMARTSLF